jgi:hypothetical protein
MRKPKPAPVLGGIVGLLALVGLTVALMSPGSRVSPPEKRADDADAKALAAAVEETGRAYRAVAADGRAVMSDRNAPRLPERARGVLDRAAKLPAPAKDKDRLIPGSGRVTYEKVFSSLEVGAAVQDWEKVREQLKPLAE